MMLALKLHVDSACAAVTKIEVEVSRPSPSTLALHYLVTGSIQDLLLPPEAKPERTDGLWQHSCFEAFVRGDVGQEYYEFNFAPSGQWAAYRFGGYRSRMAPAEMTPAIRTSNGPSQFELHATVGLNDMSASRLGLSAVIEETNGRKSYWALAHPPGKADFHHPDSFACELP